MRYFQTALCDVISYSMLSVVQGSPADLSDSLRDLKIPRRGPPGPPVNETITNLTFNNKQACFSRKFTAAFHTLCR